MGESASEGRVTRLQKRFIRTKGEDKEERRGEAAGLLQVSWNARVHRSAQRMKEKSRMNRREIEGHKESAS